MHAARGDGRRHTRRDPLDGFKQAQAAIQAANERARRPVDGEGEPRPEVDR